MDVPAALVEISARSKLREARASHFETLLLPQPLASCPACWLNVRDGQPGHGPRHAHRQSTDDCVFGVVRIRTWHEWLKAIYAMDEHDHTGKDEPARKPAHDEVAKTGRVKFSV